MNVQILYHKNCNDGFGAAFAAWKHFGDEAVYTPYAHGPKLPDIYADTDLLYMLDISVPPDRMRILHQMVPIIHVIDHHESTMRAYGEHPAPVGVTMTFGDRAASVMSWKFFHPSTPLPWLMEYVEDYDLWHNRLPNTSQINAAIRSYPFDFKLWDEWLTMPQVDMVEVGRHVIRTEQRYWKRSLENVQVMEFGGYKVPVVNTTLGGTEVANELLKLQHVPVAGYYFDTKERRVFGLRGDGTVDVSKIAAQYGGGGHHNAAGFSIDL